MRKENKNKRQKHETEKSFNELKEITQAIREQKERSITLMCKTRLKPLTRESKKSVLEPELKK
ncbi:hypothetical protein DUHN57_14570 [Helicobacter pylori]|uniref:hypothetical protein n=1 Tax=Helicobacter pylori TaxID=210 RepID=UPI001AAAC195|nr:hypothetical protein VN0338_03760 [Helicobacter pylori]